MFIASDFDPFGFCRKPRDEAGLRSKACCINSSRGEKTDGSEGCCSEESFGQKVVEEAKRFTEARVAKERQVDEAREAARDKITMARVKEWDQGSQSPPRGQEITSSSTTKKERPLLTLSYFFSAILRRGPSNLPGKQGHPPHYGLFWKRINQVLQWLGEIFSWMEFSPSGFG